jgi:DNA processing protein
MAAKVKILYPKEFPHRLREIPDPPEQLWLEGTLPPKAHKWLCVVGSRRYSPYGKEVCERLIGGLAGKRVAIVSGLALGIDTIAHRSALEAGLRCVVVPGSGLSREVLYPVSNRGFADQLVHAGGCLVSEFKPSFAATLWSFPQRNRIMAGLADAVLVVEAEKKSGTLITARLASEYNRDVLTVPGSIFSSSAEGPHLLMRLGATPVRTSEELASALGFENVETEKKNYDDCSAEELEIIKLLKNPMEHDALLAASKLPISKTNAILSLLEIKGLIRESMSEVHLT